MTARIDHETAAFFAGMLCFWTLCAIATKWIPQLMVLWERYPGTAPIKPWKLRTIGSVWLGLGLLFGMSLLRIHWSVADTFKTLIWLGVFVLVALLGLSIAKLWSQSLLWLRGERHTPGLKPRICEGDNAKAEALAYLDATATARTKADSLRE
jgi:hypothetical protein